MDNDTTIHNNSHRNTVVDGMRYALLIIAGVGRGKYGRLIYHVACDTDGRDATVIFLYKVANGYEVLGHIDFTPGTLLDLQHETIHSMAAKLALLKDK